MVNVLPSDIRDTINVDSGDVLDEKLVKMIARAAATLSLELNRQVDPGNCTEIEKEFITLLAAVYAICYLTGGSAVGLNFSVGDQSINVATSFPPLTILQQELQRILGGLKKPSLRSA